MAIREGYKVLSPGRWSAWIRRGNGGVHYPVKVWVRPDPGCGPLAVFDTADSANHWMWKMAFDGRVVRCEYKSAHFRSLWRTVRGKLVRTRPRIIFPEGSHFASSVRTLE